ncbi:MAG: hypothetical protein R3E82_11045 [Pseudomonadales bacterium]|nr:hypothetical protein [Pseudomonadales bacterium]
MTGSHSESGIPAHFFSRADESPDENFYAAPRFVTHIDEATITSLTRFYREFLPDGARVLDLMSSWISHLPPEKQFSRVSGLGMNAQELAANPRLDDYCVHNLNRDPDLPYPPGEFDRVLIAVSVQYLIRPIEVMTSIHETLSDAGAVCIAMSHRLFPTKAVAAFQSISAEDRVRLVSHYLEAAGFSEIACHDRSPPHADPLWLVVGWC